MMAHTREIKSSEIFRVHSIVAVAHLETPFGA